jgi:Niemann-Pick C2 protein
VSEWVGLHFLNFFLARYLEHFRPNALALAMGINISYPLQQDDGCVGVTNTPCPLANGEYIEYTYSMFILPIFPKVKKN